MQRGDSKRVQNLCIKETVWWFRTSKELFVKMMSHNDQEKVESYSVRDKVRWQEISKKFEYRGCKIVTGKE